MTLFGRWKNDPAVMARQSPSLVFAVIGQGGAAERIAPEQESRLLSTVLRTWAVRSNLAELEHRQPNRPLVRAS